MYDEPGHRSTTYVLLISPSSTKYFAKPADQSVSHYSLEPTILSPMNNFPLHGPLALIAFVTVTASCVGQSVLSAAGGTHEAGPTHITYTIGEPVIATVGSGASQLTQGFNQPWADIGTAVDDPGTNEGSINVYPNPVSHSLSLAFSDNPVDHRFELFDALGKRVMDGRVQGTITELNMEPYASGGYFLRVFGPQDSFLRSFKISVNH